MSEQLTLLCMLPWLGLPEERMLLQPPEAYTIEKEGQRWWCTCDATDMLVYSGVGPVEVVRPPRPSSLCAAHKCKKPASVPKHQGGLTLFKTGRIAATHLR